MSSLYIIDRAIEECLDPETGEVIDIELLSALSMERDAKIENVTLWVKNLKAELIAVKEEKAAFIEREKQLAKKIESLEGYLATATGGEKFSTARCSLSFRPSVTVEYEDRDKVPKKYLRKKVSYEPDKVAIKAALVTGIKVRGCYLAKHLNPQIK